MKKINQLILLGAGASKSEGAPLQNELFKQFFKFYIEEKNNGVDFVGSLYYENIKKFFEIFWGIDIENFNEKNTFFPTFEECLGILDLAFDKNESFKGCNKSDITSYRYGLIFLIAKILDTKLRNKIIHHRLLVNRLKDENKLLETAFLSLNYDIIIDNILQNYTLFMTWNMELILLILKEKTTGINRDLANL